jgi:type IV pilus assembly protein PilA
MRKGFTLIELLVVIAIIGILATLVITQVSGAQIRARNSNAKSDINQMGKAIELFKNSDLNGSATSIAAGADQAQVTLNGATGTSFTTIFSGSQTIGTSTNTLSTYGVAILKTAASSSAYTYTYNTDDGAATGKVLQNNAATCYVIFTNAVDTGGTNILGYKILNSIASDTDTAPTTTCS